MELTTWVPLRFWKVWGGGGFIDTAQVLNYGECYGQIGNRIFNSDEGNCSNYLYGTSLVRILDYLSIGKENSYLVGFALALLLSLSLTQIFPIKNFFEGVYYALLISSPPILLLVERGNFDTLIFILVFLSAYFYSKNHILIAFLLISVSILIKFYTAPLLIFFLVRNYKIYMAGMIWTITFFTLFVAVQDIKLIGNFPSGTSGKFGFNLWSLHFEEESRFVGNQVQSFVINTLVFTFTISLFFMSLKFKLIDEIKLRDWQKSFPRNSTTISFFAVVLITCFFAGLNFDYRLIFFAALNLLIVKKVSGRSSKMLYLYSLSVLWLTYPSAGLAPIGDLLLEMFVVAIFWFGMLKLHLRVKRRGL
jgi:hypothetical protein